MMTSDASVLAVVALVGIVGFAVVVKLIMSANSDIVSAAIAETRRCHEASLAEYRRMYGVLAMSKGMHPHHVEPAEFAPSGIGMAAVKAAAEVLDQDDLDQDEFKRHQQARSKEHMVEQLREAERLRQHQERIDRLRAERTGSNA